jgi:single-strand DNA-binding protein
MSTIICTGRLGRDGELRTTQSETKVLSFSVADDIGYGENKRTQWLDCALFGKRAEALAQYLTKGTIVEIVGEPSIRTYEGKNGAGASLQVKVQEIKLHGGKSKDAPVADNARATSGDDMDSDIPW